MSGDGASFDIALRRAAVSRFAAAEGKAHWPLARLYGHAEERPDAPCLTAMGAESAHDRTLSYAQMAAAVSAMAAWLQSAHGVSAQTRIALVPANRLPSVLAIFALMRLGAPVLLLNPSDPEERRGQLLRLVGPHAIFHDPSFEFPFEALPADIGALPAGGLCAPGPEDAPSLAADAFLIGTSGSTAASKVVRQSRGNTAANAADIVAHHRLTPDDRLLGCLPIFHVNGLHLTLMASVYAGAHAWLLPGFDPFTYPQALERAAPRIASVVPSILHSLAALWRGRALPEGFGYFVSAAAPLTAETARAVHAAMGARIVQGYGLTETTNFSCTMPPNLDEDSYRRLVLDADIPPVGQAVGNEIAILGPDDTLLPDGETGEVAMRGPNVMTGYLHNEDETARAFEGGWFRSGDLGFIAKGPAGMRLVTLTGRIKNIAKVRGENVSLEEMDRALASLPDITDAACVAVPDGLQGERIVAAIACSAEIGDEEIKAALARHFAKKVLPEKIVRLKTIPRTPTGKIVRRDLAAALGL